MAIVEETIGTGQDRTTIAAWEAAVGVFWTDTYKGIISTNDEFNENVTLTGSTGTPSITSYLWLTTDPTNRHSGVAGTGHGRMRGSTNGSHVLTLDAPFTRVDWLEIQQDSTGASDEAIRVLADRDDCLIDYCILWTDQTVSDQDGIHVSQVDLANLRLSNTIIYGFNRAGLSLQLFDFGSINTHTADVDHCAFYDCGVTGENGSAAILLEVDHTSSASTIGIYNTWGAVIAVNSTFVDTDDSAQTQPNTPQGTATWNGSNNLGDIADPDEDVGGTNNLTSWQTATDGVAVVTKSSGSWLVVNSVTGGSENFTLLDTAAGNLAAGNGTNRQGSEPDTRQDFSIDITGSARSTTTVDIGAHNVNTAGKFINSLLQSNKNLKTDDSRLASTGLLSARKI